MNNLIKVYRQILIKVYKKNLKLKDKTITIIPKIIIINTTIIITIIIKIKELDIIKITTIMDIIKLNHINKEDENFEFKSYKN